MKEILFEAIQFGNRKRLEKLLEQRPDLLNISFSHGETPLRWAIENNQLAIAKFLVSKGAKLQT